MGATVYTVLTVSTVNVNGLRAAARKGFVEWLSATTADVVCLQETRAEHDQLSKQVIEPAGWRTVLAPSSDKGRSGVALYMRAEPDEVRETMVRDDKPAYSETDPLDCRVDWVRAFESS